jgi:hypothetical protein
MEVRGMGESNLDNIERADLQDAPSLELVKALSLRRKIIAHNIERTWRVEIPHTGENGNDVSPGTVQAM